KERLFRVMREQLVTRGRIAPEPEDGRGDIAMQDRGDVLWQIVEERRNLLEEQRQVVLDAGCRDTARDVTVNAFARRIAFEDFAELGAEPCPAGFIDREFARRKQPHVAHLVNGALAVYIERADRFDRVIEE